MNRVPAMLEYVKEDMAKSVVEWQQQVLNCDNTGIKSVIVEVSMKRTSPEDDVIISYLRSSYLTGSHCFKVAIYNEVPYVETSPIQELLDMAPYYQGVDETFQLLVKKLKSKFMNIFECEIEEVRRFYMEQLYFGSLPFFQKIAEELAESQSTTPLLFGGQMGRTYQIGVI